MIVAMVAPEIAGFAGGAPLLTRSCMSFLDSARILDKASRFDSTLHCDGSAEVRDGAGELEGLSSVLAVESLGDINLRSMVYLVIWSRV